MMIQKMFPRNIKLKKCNLVCYPISPTFFFLKKVKKCCVINMLIHVLLTSGKKPGIDLHS